MLQAIGVVLKDYVLGVWYVEHRGLGVAGL